jgi:hypothetical protein
MNSMSALPNSQDIWELVEVFTNSLLNRRASSQGTARRACESRQQGKEKVLTQFDQPAKRTWPRGLLHEPVDTRIMSQSLVGNA